MKYYCIPPYEIIRLYRLENHKRELDNYLSVFKDVLEHLSIFESNFLDSSVQSKDFSLFQRVYTPEPDAVIVIGLYLELLEYWGEQHKMIRILEDAHKRYPNHKVIAYWNHDRDFSQYNMFIPENVYILNHGFTSEASPQDILLPFWNIVDNPYTLEKTSFASFIGTPNNALRAQLIQSIQSYNHPDIQYKKVYGEDYLKELNSTLFCLCPKGGPEKGGFSYRVFEVIQARSIPVIFVDILQYPMTELVNWDKICIRLPERSVTDMEFVHSQLRSIDPKPYLDAIEVARNQFSLLGVQKYICNRLA
jgi:hypothetical protein